MESDHFEPTMWIHAIQAQGEPPALPEPPLDDPAQGGNQQLQQNLPVGGDPPPNPVNIPVPPVPMLPMPLVDPNPPPEDDANPPAALLPMEMELDPDWRARFSIDNFYWCEECGGFWLRDQQA